MSLIADSTSSFTYRTLDWASSSPTLLPPKRKSNALVHYANSFVRFTARKIYCFIALPVFCTFGIIFHGYHALYLAIATSSMGHHTGDSRLRNKMWKHVKAGGRDLVSLICSTAFYAFASGTLPFILDLLSIYLLLSLPSVDNIILIKKRKALKEKIMSTPLPANSAYTKKELLNHWKKGDEISFLDGDVKKIHSRLPEIQRTFLPLAYILF